MPKVIITLEAEIGDLSGFWPDEPRGATTGNVYDLLKLMQLASMEAKMEVLTDRSLDTRTKQNLANSYDQQIELATRLLQRVTIVVE